MLTRSECNCWWQRQRERERACSSFIWVAVERFHHASCWQDICQIGIMQLPRDSSVTLCGSSYPDIFLVGKIGSNISTDWDSHDSRNILFEALHILIYWIYGFTTFCYYQFVLLWLVVKTPKQNWSSKVKILVMFKHEVTYLFMYDFDKYITLLNYITNKCNVSFTESTPTCF